MDPRVRDQKVADLDPGARDEVEHARRHPRFPEQLHQPRGGHRRLDRRLEQHGFAGYQRCRGHAGQDRHGEVPRGDHHRHTARLVEVIVRLTGHRIKAAGPVQAEHLAAVVLEVVDRLGDVGIRLAPVLADLEHLQRRQSVPLLANPLGHPEEQVRALPRRRVSPAGEGAVRGPHGPLRVLQRCRRRAAHDLGGARGVD